jgi:hypothetical protein
MCDSRALRILCLREKLRFEFSQSLIGSLPCSRRADSKKSPTTISAVLHNLLGEIASISRLTALEQCANVSA